MKYLLSTLLALALAFYGGLRYERNHHETLREELSARLRITEADRLAKEKELETLYDSIVDQARKDPAANNPSVSTSGVRRLNQLR